MHRRADALIGHRDAPWWRRPSLNCAATSGRHRAARLNGLSYTEIAQIVGRTEATVRSHRVSRSGFPA